MAARGGPEIQLAAKRRMRSEADARFRELSRQEPDAAEDPIVLQDIETALEALRHEINALDVEIAILEQEVSDQGRSNM